MVVVPVLPVVLQPLDRGSLVHKLGWLGMVGPRILRALISKPVVQGLNVQERAAATLEARDGQIVRQVNVEAWDE